LTLSIAEGLLRLWIAAAHDKKVPQILRVFVKSCVDFLFASGIKKVLEHNAKSKAASQRPRVVSGVKKRVCIYDPRHRTITQCLGVHAMHASTPLRAAAGGAQKTTERP
jgi:hypothetical protein